MSILYIDDDPEDIEIFQDAIKTVDPSIACYSATSGREAFLFLNGLETLPDHIVIDINMPGMDGKTCLQELRKEKRFDSVNVIIYSTNSFSPDLEHFASMRATYMKKASSFNEICDMIRTLANQDSPGTA